MVHSALCAAFLPCVGAALACKPTPGLAIFADGRLRMIAGMAASRWSACSRGRLAARMAGALPAGTPPIAPVTSRRLSHPGGAVALASAGSAPAE